MSLNITRRRLLGGTAAVMGGTLLGPMPTASARTAPRLHTRAEWRARAPKTAATVLDRAPDRIVVHHTASPNSTNYSLEHAFDLSRSIQNFHMDTNGWDDTGQQLTISRGGHVMEGRNRSLDAVDAGDHVLGAHTLSHNEHTIGIENEGTYMTEEPTDALWEGLVATCSWLCETYGLDPRTAIVGHRDHNSTACPGDTLYALLPKLRDQVAAGRSGARLTVTARVAPSGLPGPRHRFDHGPVGRPVR
ncbi:hypothetical protein GCM10010182_08500 [Actinomadura cremea]|nr:hypothetical protein GCM10010182_08500 [Actinomadura cremea]